MSENPDIRHEAFRVGIVGAGLSGLVCARSLAERGLEVKVFDKARGPGGRMSTRRSGDWRFDHGAQYFTARDPRFSQQVDSWRQLGLVEKWAARIAVLEHGSMEFKGDTAERFVGVPGMNAICRHLAAELDVAYQTVVGDLERNETGWDLTDANDTDIGQFDAIVISAPAPQSARLVDRVAPSIAAAAASVEMAPCWAAMVGFASPLETAFDGAFVVDSPLSWVARNASKPGRPNDESWVLHASPEWSQRHLEADREAAGQALLDALADALGGLSADLAHIVTHRWRFALPVEPLAEPCLADPDLQIVACGDWCGGPRVEGAFQSGLEAARHIEAFRSGLRRNVASDCR